MEFLSKAGLTYYHTKIKTLLAGKVDKETGKGLSTNDYTASDQTKLSGLADIKSIGAGLSLDPSTGELTSTITPGSTDYTQLTNKPQINGVELTGNKSLADIGIDEITNSDIDALFT